LPKRGWRQLRRLLPGDTIRATVEPATIDPALWDHGSDRLRLRFSDPLGFRLSVGVSQIWFEEGTDFSGYAKADLTCPRQSQQPSGRHWASIPPPSAWPH
jgi:hypothetical protein